MFWNSITVPLISDHVNHSCISSSLLPAAHGTAGRHPYQIFGNLQYKQLIMVSGTALKMLPLWGGGFSQADVCHTCPEQTA